MNMNMNSGGFGGLGMGRGGRAGGGGGGNWSSNGAGLGGGGGGGHCIHMRGLPFRATQADIADVSKVTLHTLRFVRFSLSSCPRIVFSFQRWSAEFREACYRDHDTIAHTTLCNTNMVFHFHFSSQSFVRLVNVLKHFSVFQHLSLLKSLKPLHVSA
jgi:hypothetical protein